MARARWHQARGQSRQRAPHGSALDWIGAVVLIAAAAFARLSVGDAVSTCAGERAQCEAALDEHAELVTEFDRLTAAAARGGRVPAASELAQLVRTRGRAGVFGLHPVVCDAGGVPRLELRVANPKR